MHAVTRKALAEAVRKVCPALSCGETQALVAQVLNEIEDALVRGEQVKLSGFGVFHLRHKGTKIGRNPKTLVEVAIPPRCAIFFKASPISIMRVNKEMNHTSGCKKAAHLPVRTLSAEAGSGSGIERASIQQFGAPSWRHPNDKNIIMRKADD